MVLCILLALLLLQMELKAIQSFATAVTQEKHYTKYCAFSRPMKVCHTLHMSKPIYDTVDANSQLKRCLAREYSSFFSPMEKQFYSPNVEFLDPLNNIKGIDNYQKNVDMLAGRTKLGRILFHDASIVLHSVESLPDGRIQTRWTLQVQVKFVPWKPRPRFTGVSVYTLDGNGIVIKQEDYWDSINLRSGEYSSAAIGDAVGDFLSQCKRDDGAELSAPELPVR